jgi:hypothetical protein
MHATNWTSKKNEVWWKMQPNGWTSTMDKLNPSVTHCTNFIGWFCDTKTGGWMWPSWWNEDPKCCGDEWEEFW